jgi:hypothetical protein
MHARFLFDHDALRVAHVERLGRELMTARASKFEALRSCGRFGFYDDISTCALDNRL